MTDSSIPPKDEWVPALDSEWQQWLLLRRIWRAITNAMQPARLAIGLLMIVAIGTFGSGWDRTFQPSIAPQGLWHGSATEAHRATEQAMFQDLAEHYIARERWLLENQDLDSEELEWMHIDTRWLVRELKRGYSAMRSEADTDRQPDMDVRFVGDLQLVNDVRLKGSWESLATACIEAFNRFVHGCATLNFSQAWQGLGALVVSTPVAIWNAAPWFSAIFALVLVVVLALGGGALSRLAILQFATGERMTMRESFTVALAMWRSLIGSQVLPLVFIGAFVGILLLVGLVMRVPLLNIVGGLGLGIWLLFGFTIAFLLICYAAGYCMLIPAVMAELGDSADSMQRSFSYVANRPLHLVAAYVLALLGLVIGYIIVAAIAALTVNATLGSMEFAAGGALVGTEGRFSLFDVVSVEPRAVISGWTNTSAAWLMNMWLYVVSALVAGYVVAYVFSASSIIYLIMRRIVDGQAIDDLWIPAAAVEQADGAASQAASNQTTQDQATEKGDAHAGDDSSER